MQEGTKKFIGVVNNLIFKGVGESKIGVTKKDKSQSPASLKISKESRKANRKKKRHIKTAKEKKVSK